MMSATLLKQCLIPLARTRTLPLQSRLLASPKTPLCCSRQYHDPNELYRYWDYDPPGVQKKGENYLAFLKRNLQYKMLEIKNHVAPRNIRPQQSRVIWEYDGPESIDAFAVSTDASIGGKSKAYVTSSRNNKLLFYGRLDTDLPRDGKTERSGYCNLQLKERYGAFNKEIPMNLEYFNKLTLRVRGDGRSYIVNLKTKLYFAEMEQDLWSYVFYTRGGPYWQDISLPFSKFFLSSKGRIQDRQAPIELDKISWIGIVLGDKITGEFSLEIDTIKAEYDPSHYEEFAYEKYGGFKI